MSGRRACRLAGQHRSTNRHQGRKRQIPGLAERLLEHAVERPRLGYKRLTMLLRRDGFRVDHKRIYRMYSEQGLAVRRKKRNRASQVPRPALPAAASVNDCWSMDFLSDALEHRRALRIFAAIDDYSRRGAAMGFDVALPAERVTRILDRAIETCGTPRRIRTDNGPEFTIRAFDSWCYIRVAHFPNRDIALIRPHVTCVRLTLKSKSRLTRGSRRRMRRIGKVILTLGDGPTRLVCDTHREASGLASEEWDGLSVRPTGTAHGEMIGLHDQAQQG